MKEMMLRDIYDIMYYYAIQNAKEVSYDEESCYVGFKDYIDQIPYSVSMKTKYFGKVNHIEFNFPKRIPSSKIKEASRIANELNCQIRFGSFRLVEHNGRVRYCFDSILEYSQIDTDYFESIVSLSEQTIKKYAKPLLDLCK